MPLSTILDSAWKLGMRSTRQLRVMMIFRDHPSIDFGKASRIVKMSKPAFGRAIEVLCKAGLLSNRQNGDDNRLRILSTTDYGDKFLKFVAQKLGGA